MPMYEFRCLDCHQSFEELVYNTVELDEVDCPRCESSNITKQLSAFAVHMGSSGQGISEASQYSGGGGGGCDSGGGCCGGGMCG